MSSPDRVIIFETPILYCGGASAMTAENDGGQPPGTTAEENLAHANMEPNAEVKEVVSTEKTAADSSSIQKPEPGTGRKDTPPEESAASNNQENDGMSQEKDAPKDALEEEQVEATAKQPASESVNTAASAEKDKVAYEKEEPNDHVNESSQEDGSGANEALLKSAEAPILSLASDSTDNNNKEAIRRSGSLLDNDEEDTEKEIVKDESPPPLAQEVSNLTLENTPTKTEEAPTTRPSSKGAQILMNRFSAWRKNTNRTLSRNAETLLNSPVGQSLSNQARSSLFSQNSRGSETAKESEKPSSSKDMGDNNVSASSSSSSSLEEEGSATSSDSSNNTSSPDDVDSTEHATNDQDNYSFETTPRSSLEDSSIMTDETPSERQQRVAGAALVVQAAASGIVDSVASGFRGRYAAGTEPDTTPKRKGRSVVNMTESQTSLIMKSRAATHMQSILDALEPHEYVMLLGKGMLGVNLRQTYLKNNGVYMDYFLPGGAAETSGVVFPGDVLIKVGDTDVRRGTIHDVPETIAASRRPVVLVFSNGMDMEFSHINYIDVAVAMMHKIREESKHLAIASMPLHAENIEESSEEVDETDDGDDKSSKDDTAVEQGTTEPTKQIPDVEIPMHSFIDSNVMSPLTASTSETVAGAIYCKTVRTYRLVF